MLIQLDKKTVCVYLCVYMCVFVNDTDEDHLSVFQGSAQIHVF